jgi:hypothetical protein
MKVLFCDVDGVLNCAKYFNTRHTPRDLKPKDLDPARVLILHRILEATGAKVVVSSSWRNDEESLNEIKQAAEPFYLDKTGRLPSYQDRHEEIREWLGEHPEVTKYAILDDDECAGLGHGGNFFKTEWYGEGLNEKIAELLIKHFE